MTKTNMVEMPKSYDPKLYEDRWYSFWESHGYFTPEIDWGKKPFTIIMPPPNITGELHVGHALTASIEDILIRWHRMMGDPTLWLPGEDSAAIAAQNVVERLLAKEGLSRYDLGREKFLERMWEWANKYRRIIADQHKRLGASCDWTRERFTMDPGPYKAVRTAFVRLYERGLIYRGNRIINWCPRCATALSDLEVDHREEESSLTYVKYPLVPKDGGRGGEPEYVVVATTRPETILGDTGIAVNPADDRYQGVVGRLAVVPEVGRLIPIVADEAVDPAFGSGAVKVTPGHDPTDFEIGLRHELPIIEVIGTDDRMTDAAGKYAGMPKLEARKALVEDLRKQGLIVKVEPLRHSVGHCQRCGTIAEPLVMEQWFVKTKPLAEPAIEAVRDGRTRIIPDRFTKVYYNWMENIRDWCISRQLWWGHRIPVWYCDACGEVIVAVDEPEKCERCGGALRQDPDVLDTWFSSGLWPISTLGWPDDTEDLRYFYPTSVMETGYDILFFWVARMMMQCMAMVGEVPFRDVYLHGLVRIGGEKMSKSKGNVINPLDVIDQYGADALRFALVTGTTPGNDSQMSVTKLEASRNFANKLWNAARFVVSNVPHWEPGDLSAPLPLPSGPHATDADRWIVSRLNAVANDVQRLLEAYQLGEAARSLHEFIWNEYCDWYIEIAKVQLREAQQDAEHGPASSCPGPGDEGSTTEHSALSTQHPSQPSAEVTRQTLAAVLERSLRLLHPFAPFVTEEVWQSLLGRPAENPRPGVPASIVIAPWPTAGERDQEAEGRMERVMEIIRGIRNTRAENGVDPAKFVPVILLTDEWADLMRSQAAVISALARLQSLEIRPEGVRPKRALVLIAGGVEVYLPLEGLFDVEQEISRLSKEIAAAENDVRRGEALLAKPGFVEKAPAEVVAREREKVESNRDRLARLLERLEMLKR
ncbi:MAG: valine--tRNA ligase [Sphingomonadaceae bacterium]